MRLPRRRCTRRAWPSSGTRWSASTSTRPRSTRSTHGKAPFFEPGCDELLHGVAAPPAGCASPPTWPTVARRATCTSSASARRSSAGEYAADLLRRRRGRRRWPPHLTRRRPGRRASRRCRSAPPAGCAEQLAAVAPRARSRWPGTRSSCARASPSRTPCAPDRLVYGVPAAPTRRGRRRACSTRCTPRPLAAGTPRMVTDYATAELVKVAANSFLATKISFINAMAEVCEAAGADVTPAGRRDRPRRPDRAQVPQRRPRLRRRLPAQGHPGVHGPGRRARRRPGADASCARSTRSTCAAGRGWSTWPARCCGGTLLGKRGRRPRRGVQAQQRRHPRLPGAGRRPRRSRRRGPGHRARPRGAATTPRAPAPTSTTPTARGGLRAAPTSCCCSPSGSEYRELDPAELGHRRGAQPAVLDGRNALDPDRWRAAGWTYRALGRPSA